MEENNVIFNAIKKATESDSRLQRTNEIKLSEKFISMILENQITFEQANYTLQVTSKALEHFKIICR